MNNQIAIINPTKGIRTEPRLLATECADRGDQVAFVTPKVSEHVPKGENIRVYRYNAFFIPGIRYTIPGFGLILTLVSIFKECDICYSGGYIYPPNAISIILGRLMGVKTVVIVNNLVGVDWFYDNLIVDIVGRIYTESIGRAIFSMAHVVVAQGKYLEESLKRYAPKDKVRVIQTGIDVEKYTPKDSRADVGNEIKLLYVGRLDPVKRVDLLLKAFSQLQEGPRQYSLTIVGDGTKRAEYERMADNLGISPFVSFEGWQSNVEGYYHGADIFVLASRSEGPPTVIREAEACGVPVVATDVGGVSELVSGGIVVDPGSAKELATGISKLADSDLERQGKIARQYICQNFTLDAMIKEYREFV